MAPHALLYQTEVSVDFRGSWAFEKEALVLTGLSSCEVKKKIEFPYVYIPKLSATTR